MLHLITGTPGSGKTLYAVSLIMRYVKENEILLIEGKDPRPIYADIDEWDMTPGLTTNAYEDFVNKDGKSSLKVDTYKTVQVYSASDTLTAKMPNGQNEGDKLAIRVIFYAGPSMGTNYVYEWKPVE